MIESAGGQQMFVDVITQQKLVPVERAGELTLVNVLEDDTDDSELTREIEVCRYKIQTETYREFKCLNRTSVTRCIQLGL